MLLIMFTHTHTDRDRHPWILLNVERPIRRNVFKIGNLILALDIGRL